jgi:mono/diheme cytochrome c family protein
MTIIRRLCAGVVLVACTTLAGAQEKEVKHVPVKPTSAASGQEMFVMYCAVCHGKDGKGGGPAADALKVPPANLTTLAQKNGGKYPAAHVATVVRGDANLPAHGNKEMPVWGPIFWTMSGGHESEVMQRVTNLTKFVESLQTK